jgi:hypothetical protein
MLAAGAEVLNDHLKTVIDLIQNGTVLDRYRFKSPPVFSIPHRATAIVLEAIRTFIKIVSVIPVLMMDKADGREVADQVYESASLHGVALQAYALGQIVAVECVSSLGEYFQPFGQFMISAFNVGINGAELLYDMSARAAVGISSSESYPRIGWSKLHCESYITYTDHPVGRIRNALIQFSKRYSDENVPLQEDMALSVRKIIAEKFLAVAVAESLYTLSLFFIGWRWVVGSGSIHDERNFNVGKCITGLYHRVTTPGRREIRRHADITAESSDKFARRA